VISLARFGTKRKASYIFKISGHVWTVLDVIEKTISKSRFGGICSDELALFGPTTFKVSFWILIVVIIFDSALSSTSNRSINGFVGMLNIVMVVLKIESILWSIAPCTLLRFRRVISCTLLKKNNIGLEITYCQLWPPILIFLDMNLLRCSCNHKIVNKWHLYCISKNLGTICNICYKRTNVKSSDSISVLRGWFST